MERDQEVFDTAVELCRDKHCRIILAKIMRNGRSQTLNELMIEVVSQIYQVPITEVSEEVRMEVYLALYHKHVPKLAKANVLTYHRERQFVEPGSQFETLEQYLTTILRADPALNKVKPA